MHDHDEICLSIRFVPGVAGKVGEIVYGGRDGRHRELAVLLQELHAFVKGLGFVVTTTGAATMCIRGTRQAFYDAFKPKMPLDEGVLDPYAPVVQEALDRVAHQLPGFIRDIAFQRPFEPLSSAVGWPPPKPGRGRLDLLKDVPAKLAADRVHAARHDGSGIRVAVLDSEFDFDHPFFLREPWKCRPRLQRPTEREVAQWIAAGMTTETGGHGTAMAASVLAVAPGAEIVGMHELLLLEGFVAAIDVPEGRRPHVVSISLARDACDRDKQECWTAMPTDCLHIADELNYAVTQGVVVVVGAGNGHYGFPAMLKQVIAVGGVHVDSDDARTLRASNLASAFRSSVQDADCLDRHVPDVCGLVGMDGGDYIVMPVAPGSTFERNFPLPGPAGASGWALFSGTSAATAQIAGVCALVLQKQKLEPDEVKNLLCNTARDVVEGSANPKSNLGHSKGLRAGPDKDGATGYGLVDAYRAWHHADDPEWSARLRT